VEQQLLQMLRALANRFARVPRITLVDANLPTRRLPGNSLPAGYPAVRIIIRRARRCHNAVVEHNALVLAKASVRITA